MRYLGVRLTDEDVRYLDYLVTKAKGCTQTLVVREALRRMAFEEGFKDAPLSAVEPVQRAPEVRVAEREASPGEVALTAEELDAMFS